VGDDQPIMQWIPLIQGLQARNAPVIVDLSQAELDDFMAAMQPEGLFLWIAANGAEEQLTILRRLERWR
jgi:hypothetical protein